MIVKMIWVEGAGHWLMQDKDGYTILPIPNCRNTNTLFKDLDKTKTNKYDFEPLENNDELV